MKPDPIPPTLPRALTQDEAWLIEVSAKGGAHAITLKGVSQHATARRLVKLGLGEKDGARFTANEAGVAVVEGMER